MESSLTESPATDNLLEQPPTPPQLSFALRLGYTPTQLSTALSTLPPSPTHDELLSALITQTQHSPLPPPDPSREEPLRKIIIDGSNVAMTYGKNEEFSYEGIQRAVDYFVELGHEVVVVLPGYREEEVPEGLRGWCLFTPSREVGGRRVVCYDDRYLLQLSLETNGIILSNDLFKDLQSPPYLPIIKNNILMYSFINGKFTPPPDPQGRSGPSLPQFLRNTPLPPTRPCPYGKKCSYGPKCKFYHTKTNSSISDSLRNQLEKTQSVPLLSEVKKLKIGKSLSVPVGHAKLERKKNVDAESEEVFRTLTGIFAEEEVRLVMGEFRGCLDKGFLCTEIVRRFKSS